MKHLDFTKLAIIDAGYRFDIVTAEPSDACDHCGDAAHYVVVAPLSWGSPSEPWRACQASMISDMNDVTSPNEFVPAV